MLANIYYEIFKLLKIYFLFFFKMRVIKFFFLLSLCLSIQACKNPAEVADEHFQQGKVFFNEKNYDKANAELSLATQLNPHHVDAFYYIALIDEVNKRWQPMFDNLERVIYLNPNYLQAHLKLASVEAAANLIEKADKEIDIVLHSEPNNVEALIIKGLVLLKKKLNQEAMHYVENALDLEPKNVHAITLKTSILIQEKEYKSALELVDKALDAKPNDISLYVAKLQVNQATNDVQAIEEDYINLIKRLPDNLDLRYSLIKIYTETNRFVDADAMYKSILNKNPKDFNIKKAYVDFIEKNDPKNTIAIVREFIKQNPENVDMYLKLADLYIKSQQISEAKKVLNSVVTEHNATGTDNTMLSKFDIKKDSKQVLQAKAVLASIAFQEHDEAEASKLINDVLSIDARNYDALLMQAKIKIANNKIDEALSILRILTNEYPDKDEQFVLMANAYLMQSMPELANDAFRKAVEINPANFDAVIPVANKMIEHNDLKRAELLINKSLQYKPDQAEALRILEKIHELNKS
ncbi:tetratricopeptide repeat protein [Methylomonas sp. AM2-LC]|uniref:tetratricopeptide repeat protein n=1 Tax=Methylomonas sp. AM2-LC TaxID=3153301 RepID=UPI0032670CB9